MPRKVITISAAHLAADLSDFPLRVPIVQDTDIGAVCHANGYDISFADSLGNLLPHERREWSLTNGSVNAVFFIKCNLSANGTTIFIRYGDQTVTTDPSQPAVVWADYWAVYPMTSLTTVATGQTVADIAGNNRYITVGANEVVVDDVTHGKMLNIVTIGKPYISTNTPYKVAVSAIFKRPESGTASLFGSHQSRFVTSAPYSNFFCVDHNGELTARSQHDTFSLGNIGDANHLLVNANASSVGNNNDTRAYANGQQIGEPYSATWFGNFYFGIARLYSTAIPMIKELRVRNGVLSDPASWQGFESANLTGFGDITMGQELSDFCTQILPHHGIYSCI